MSNGNRREARWFRRLGWTCCWALILAWALLFAGRTAARGAEPSEPIILRAGESTVIAVPEVSRVAVGQPSIADVRVLSAGEILVNGKSEGQTTLLLWHPAGKVVERPVRVLCSPPALSENDVRDLVADDGVRVRSVAGYVVVEGEPGPDGRARLARLSTLLGDRLLDLTGAAGGGRDDQASSAVPNQESDLSAVTGLLRQRGGERVALTRQAGKIVLEGEVRSEATHRVVVQLAEAFFPGQVVDALRVTETAGLFSIKARLIEVDRQASRELGLEWPAAMAAGERVVPNGVRLEPLARLEPLLVKLKALEESGRARILAEPTMTVMDGAEGCFLAGGQIPVPLEANGQVSMEWKEYGVRLLVRPVLQSSGRIRLTARPEVSTLDWANGIRLGAGTVPALRSRWAETAVEQESGDTLVLAGLSLTEETDHGGRVPALADVPILGGLFRTNRGARRETELTILLTTTLLSSSSPAEEVPSGDER
ncbi:MAG: type II and III secretion system protein family protein [Betaproteobacteria bacterium]